MGKNIAVLGLGIFGSKIAVELEDESLGNQVMAVDSDPKKVDKIKDYVSQALIADITDEDTLRELDIAKFDFIILGMGSYLQSQILCITFLKKLNARHVIAKANTSVQKEILMKVGADSVILPEEDSAEILAKKLSFQNITEIFNFGGGFFAKVKVPKRMYGYTLKDLDLRQKYRISAILLKKKGDVPKMIWNPNTVLDEGDELTVIAEQDNITEVFGE